MWADQEALEFCGMAVQPPPGDILERTADDPYFEYQDEWAHLMGKFSLLFIGARERRSFWLRLAAEGCVDGNLAYTEYLYRRVLA